MSTNGDYTYSSTFVATARAWGSLSQMAKNNYKPKERENPSIQNDNKEPLNLADLAFDMEEDVPTATSSVKEEPKQDSTPPLVDLSQKV